MSAMLCTASLAATYMLPFTRLYLLAFLDIDRKAKSMPPALCTKNQQKRKDKFTPSGVTPRASVPRSNPRLLL